MSDSGRPNFGDFLDSLEGHPCDCGHGEGWHHPNRRCHKCECPKFVAAAKRGPEKCKRCGGDGYYKDPAHGVASADCLDCGGSGQKTALGDRLLANRPLSTTYLPPRDSAEDLAARIVGMLPGQFEVRLGDEIQEIAALIRGHSSGSASALPSAPAGRNDARRLLEFPDINGPRSCAHVGCEGSLWCLLPEQEDLD